MRKLVLLTPLALFACAAQQGVPVGLDQVPPGSTCVQSGALDTFRGQVPSAELGARIMAAARTPHLRWVAHGMMVTMEYRADRVTVWLGPDNRIQRVNCG
jgi:hypothetical protein